ncbi:unnamed protein product [Linum trigynum]|uniref:Uncharacterized protein n=1 Tax=Linum trigynum TaxID=586398 RepID=A0AAV2GCH5_9ROSI
MLEGIRGYMMDRVVIKHKMLLETTDMLCRRIRKRLEKDKEFARLCVSRHALHDRCEVNNPPRRGKRVAVQEEGNNARPRCGKHCSKCGQPTYNARTCPLNSGLRIHDVRLNVVDRVTVERELRRATQGVSVYVDENTGNQYVRLNGDRGRPHGDPLPVRATQALVVDWHGSQPPTTQP